MQKETTNLRSYLKILKHILEDGYLKENRTGTDTLAMPGISWEHDMSDGFPLLTTRKLPMKAIAAELEGFIKGITSKRWYQEKNCRFWDFWCNPEKLVGNARGSRLVVNDSVYKLMQKEEDDLGPLGYSYQMRNFNLAYDENCDGTLRKIDQLKNIVDKLKNHYNDRRMLVINYNPAQLDKMALPPCTVAWGVTVIGNKLHLSWFQRSVDTIKGMPSDIANMALMLMLLCRQSGFEPGKLSALFMDCHLYVNHIETAKKQLMREPRESPSIIIRPESGDFDIFQWTNADLILQNYNPHPAIKMGDIAV